MGPSVKFVLPIIDAFPDKKNGGNFWCGKKGRNGGGWGGSEGVAFFGRKFSRLSFLNTSLSHTANACRKLEPDQFLASMLGLGDSNYKYISTTNGTPP